MVLIESSYRLLSFRVSNNPCDHMIVMRSTNYAWLKLSVMTYQPFEFEILTANGNTSVDFPDIKEILISNCINL